MTQIFYLITFFPILWEIITITDTKRVSIFINRIIGYKNRPVELLTKTETNFALLQLGYHLWCFVGLFSSQWLIFLLILVSGLIPKKSVRMRRLDAIITLTQLLFLVLNVYHFKIDLFSELTNFLN